MSCHSILQRIFPAQGLNLGVLHCRQFFTIWATGKTCIQFYVFVILCIISCHAYHSQPWVDCFSKIPSPLSSVWVTDIFYYSLNSKQNCHKIFFWNLKTSTKQKQNKYFLKIIGKLYPSYSIHPSKALHIKTVIQGTCMAMFGVFIHSKSTIVPPLSWIDCCLSIFNVHLLSTHNRKDLLFLAKKVRHTQDNLQVLLEARLDIPDTTSNHLESNHFGR